jgi:hypothetical protein
MTTIVVTFFVTIGKKGKGNGNLLLSPYLLQQNQNEEGHDNKLSSFSLLQQNQKEEGDGSLLLRLIRCNITKKKKAMATVVALFVATEPK